jgi:hypothetical protein
MSGSTQHHGSKYIFLLIIRPDQISLVAPDNMSSKINNNNKGLFLVVFLGELAD